MVKRSAGILPYRQSGAGVEVLIGHPGGPFWAGKDHGAWSIIKGELGEEEDPFTAARREFAEETGFRIEAVEYLDLGEVQQKAGKIIRAWSCSADLDENALISNTFTTEWPPRSGEKAEFPEIDRVAWCAPHEARQLLNPAQTLFIDRLLALLADGNPDGGD